MKLSICPDYAALLGEGCDYLTGYVGLELLSCDDDQRQQTSNKIWRIKDNWDQLSRYVESPIELKLAPFLCTLEDGYETVSVSESGKMVTRLGVQTKFGPYTADFSFCCMVGDLSSTLIIECDGHQFHSITKEQASHDRKRDRWFQGEGIKVLRYTGAEIYKDPGACAYEIEGFLRAAMDALVGQAVSK